MFPPLYHAHHKRRSDDLGFWLRLANRQNGAILELGCGTGRVLIPLAKAGFQVTGVDKDFDMLTYLRKQMPAEVAEKISLIQADFTLLPVRVQYELILLPCNTYSTLSEGDRLEVLYMVRTHLTPNGLYAVSIPNPVMLADLPTEGSLELEETFNHPETGYSVEVFSSWKRNRDQLTFYYRYDHIFPDGHIESMVTSNTHYIETLEAYLSQFSFAGLRIHSKYGDFEGIPFEYDSSYLILLAVRDQ